MKKRLCCAILALVITFSVTGCRTGDSVTPADTQPPGGDSAAISGEIPADWKVGIITGTAYQNEEEFQTAQKMILTYGADKILTATYSDSFNGEAEAVIEQAVSLAEKGAQAIIFCQAVPGTAAAISAVREEYPDTLFIAGASAESPREIASVADLVLQIDDIAIGNAIANQAKNQGAEVFIHYSFPRHLRNEIIAQRRLLIMENCERLGILFVEVIAPDPTGEAGVMGTRQFIEEDIPRRINEYGANTAFFGTNCSMQEPMIRFISELGAIYPQPCCPSPYHAYPTALNISAVGHEGDIQYILDKITERVAGLYNTGRMSGWSLPVNSLFIEAGSDYAVRYLQGEFTDRFDAYEIQQSIGKICDEYGYPTDISIYSDAEGNIENYLTLFCEYYDF